MADRKPGRYVLRCFLCKRECNETLGGICNECARESAASGKSESFVHLTNGNTTLLSQKDEPPASTPAEPEEARPFDVTIGRLDRVLSELMEAKRSPLDAADAQTLKHHAEDMRAAADSILRALAGVEATPQPGASTSEGPDPYCAPDASGRIACPHCRSRDAYAERLEAIAERDAAALEGARWRRRADALSQVLMPVWALLERLNVADNHGHAVMAELQSDASPILAKLEALNSAQRAVASYSENTRSAGGDLSSFPLRPAHLSSADDVPRPVDAASGAPGSPSEPGAPEGREES